MRAPDAGVTTRAPQTIDAVHRFGAELLSHGCRASAILEGVAADPDCALANAYAAALFLCLTTRAGQIQAAPYLAAAQANARHATPRERATIEAVAAWSRGDEAGAAKRFAAIVAEWPHDVVAAKLCQILQLAAGDTANMVRVASQAAAADPAGYALGLLAFALDQAGETDRAETLARRAIDRNPLTDPWAQHAMAHVHCAREDWIAGRAFLRAHAASWERCSSFMLTHNWWHAALFALRLGDSAGALELFDRRVWGVRKAHSQDQLNAVSLLARLEIFGVDGAGRWNDIADHAAPHANEGVSGFAELHYLYALARAGRDGEADALAAMLGETSAGREGCPIGGLAEGLVAHARRQWYPAALALGRQRRRHARVGGSQVQRQWFDELLVDSLARAGVGAGVGGEVRACA